MQFDGLSFVVAIIQLHFSDADIHTHTKFIWFDYLLY